MHPLRVDHSIIQLILLYDDNKQKSSIYVNFNFNQHTFKSLATCIYIINTISFKLILTSLIAAK